MGCCRCYNCCGSNSAILLMTRIKENCNLRIIAYVLFLYGLNRFYLKNTVTIPIISYLLKSHFNDWLAGIFIIAYINFVLGNSRFIAYQIHTFPFASLTTILCGVFWEYITPNIFHYGVSDKYDIVAYFLGGITYLLLHYFFADNGIDN